MYAAGTIGLSGDFWAFAKGVQDRLRLNVVLLGRRWRGIGSGSGGGEVVTVIVPVRGSMFGTHPRHTRPRSRIVRANSSRSEKSDSRFAFDVLGSPRVTSSSLLLGLGQLLFEVVVVLDPVGPGLQRHRGIDAEREARDEHQEQ